MAHRVSHNPQSAYRRRTMREAQVARMQSFPKNRRLIKRTHLIWTIVVFLITSSILFLIGDLEQIMGWLKL